MGVERINLEQVRPLRSSREGEGASLVTRRRFCLGFGAALGALACGNDEPTEPNDPLIPRLGVRPARPASAITPGLYRLRERESSSLLLVPANYAPAITVPLVVALHGAGATAQGPVDFLGPYAESNGFIVLAPESAGGTWDGVEGVYGPDLTTIDWALGLTFDRCAIDFSRICLEGFSDGASYALGVGITNPELFTRVVAFSPGFVTNSAQQPAKPRIFMSHGTRDGILPIETASRVIVPQLTAAGYDVTYREFDGTHMVPPEIAREAVAFIVAR